MEVGGKAVEDIEAMEAFGGRGGNPRNRDWVCPTASCGNRNFAHRNSCHQCNEPGPEDSCPSGDFWETGYNGERGYGGRGVD